LLRCIFVADLNGNPDNAKIESGERAAQHCGTHFSLYYYNLRSEIEGFHDGENGIWQRVVRLKIMKISFKSTVSISSAEDEDEGSMFFHNSCKFLLEYMTSYPSDINSYTLLYFHQILRFVNQ
jgi:hypothetical protein